MQETEGLKKKLAERAGFEWLKATDDEYHWFDANGDIVSPTDEDGNVIWEMSACFKWLVPKATRKLADIDLSTDKEAMYKLFSLWIEEFWIPRPNPASLALALCLAIEKLMDTE